VEEMAAAASSLKGQAQELVQVVSVFKLDTNRRAAPKALAKPASKLATSTSAGDDSWETF
jgi:methyl-accepting chemotaxis protein